MHFSLLTIAHLRNRLAPPGHLEQDEQRQLGVRRVRDGVLSQLQPVPYEAVRPGVPEAQCICAGHR
jgi:hypothetical protein